MDGADSSKNIPRLKQLLPKYLFEKIFIKLNFKVFTNI